MTASIEVALPIALAAAGLAVGRFAGHLARPYCGGRSVRRERAIMLVSAGVFGVLGWRFGPVPVLPALLYLGAVGTLLLFIDLAVKRLPDPFTLPSYGVGAALLALAVPFADDGGRRLVHALIGMAALWGLYAIQHFLLPDAMGRGDVKLAGVLGLYLGWFGQPTWVAGTLLGFVLGGLAGVFLLVTRRAGLKTDFPYGPFMLAGAFLAMVASA